MRHGKDPITIVAGAAAHPAGLALAQRLVQAGHRVATLDPRGAAARAFASALDASGTKVRHHDGDAASPKRIRRTIDDVLIHYGRVDHVVYMSAENQASSAGQPEADVLDALLEKWVRGPWHWADAAIPGMMARAGGRFIFIVPDVQARITALDATHSSPASLAAAAAASGATIAMAAALGENGQEHDIAATALLTATPFRALPSDASAAQADAAWDAAAMEALAQAVFDLLNVEDEGDVPAEIRLRPGAPGAPRRRVAR